MANAGPPLTPMKKLSFFLPEDVEKFSQLIKLRKNKRPGNQADLTAIWQFIKSFTDQEVANFNKYIVHANIDTMPIERLSRPEGKSKSALKHKAK